MFSDNCPYSSIYLFILCHCLKVLIIVFMYSIPFFHFNWQQINLYYQIDQIYSYLNINLSMY